jgi:hypothetical protein
MKNDLERRIVQVRTATRVWPLISVLLLAWPAGAGVEVESHDRIGSARYKTFAFEEGTPARRPEAQERILAAVERELHAKGLTRVFGESELHVVTHVLVDRHTLEKLERKDYFDYWRGVNSVDAFDLRAGTIVVDVVDAGQQRRVWRGVASAAVKGTPAKTLARIDKIVNKLFKSFPEQ